MISVVIPAYNAERYIGQAIESVQAQGIDHWEMIVIDDGSTDRTCQIVREFVSLDPRIRLIENNHGGVSAARNTGINAANLEWIALLDADDVFLPKKLKTQLAAAQKDPDVVLWGTYAFNIGETGDVYDIAKDGPSDREAFFRLRKKGAVIMLKNSSTLFRREFALQLGGFNSIYDSSEDTELWNRMAEHGPVVVIPEPLILYRFHQQSLSVRKMEFQHTCVHFIHARNRKRLAGQDLMLDAFLQTWEQRSALSKWLDRRCMLSNTYWRNAGIMLSNKQRLSGSYWLALSILSNPFMISWRIMRKISFKLTG